MIFQCWPMKVSRARIGSHRPFSELYPYKIVVFFVSPFWIYLPLLFFSSFFLSFFLVKWQLAAKSSARFSSLSWFLHWASASGTDVALYVSDSFPPPCWFWLYLNESWLSDCLFVQVEFCICLLLTFLGYVPGIIYALYVIIFIDRDEYFDEYRRPLYAPA